MVKDIIIGIIIWILMSIITTLFQLCIDKISPLYKDWIHYDIETYIISSFVAWWLILPLLLLEHIEYYIKRNNP